MITQMAPEYKISTDIKMGELRAFYVQMALSVLFLVLIGLISLGVGNFIDCFKELKHRQLGEEYRDILIGALRAQNAWMSYDCKLERYARRELLNKKVPENITFTNRIMSDKVVSVKTFLKEAVKNFKLGKKWTDIGCYYTYKKNKHNAEKHKVVCAYD
ncbi:unnamed protein product [Cylicocyclus nassatus]|uniref:Uncharacterized protein n=1 Tax=Cylicocyclus nassatus TaxID=53992 RepID=A0AA36GK74_CYLNA|nr:unnamed protein product [Cylicocyclus nassatus]